MSHGRKSLFVTSARICRRLIPHNLLSAAELIALSPVRREADIPFIVVAAPPRSGSTLTYQLLCEAFENVHLTNLGNMVYGAPLLSWLASLLFEENRHSSYRSDCGFVSGLLGEAEGLPFWRYWLGAGLHENEYRFKPERFKSLLDSLSVVRCFRPKTVCITGYLGHVFCLSDLRRYIRKMIIVHVVRDFAENAESLWRLAKANRIGGLSSTPREVEGRDDLDLEAEVALRLYCIHRRIIEQSCRNDTIIARFEAIRSNPHGFIERIRLFARTAGVPLCARKAMIPACFDAKKHSPTPVCRRWDRLEEELGFQDLLEASSAWSE